jgi:hypothetical protein
MIVDKSVPKKYIIWVLYCNYHHVNLKYFLHSDDWLPWQQPLPFGLKNVILGCVIVSFEIKKNMTGQEKVDLLIQVTAYYR